MTNINVGDRVEVVFSGGYTRIGTVEKITDDFDFNYVIRIDDPSYAGEPSYKPFMVYCNIKDLKKI